MFGVPGQHTFFFPVDSAFDVSVPLTGYDYERGRPTGLSKMGVRHVNIKKMKSIMKRASLFYLFFDA
jgi:hypothetical protein